MSLASFGLVLVGLVLILSGLALVWPPLAFLFGGGVVLLCGLLAEVGTRAQAPAPGGES